MSSDTGTRRQYSIAEWTSNESVNRVPAKTHRLSLIELLDWFQAQHFDEDDTFDPLVRTKNSLPSWAPLVLSAKQQTTLADTKTVTMPHELGGLNGSCLVLDYDGGTPSIGLVKEWETAGAHHGSASMQEAGADNNPNDDANADTVTSPTPGGVVTPTPETARGPSLEDLCTLWGDYACAVHSTCSSTPEKPRTRVIIPLSRDVSAVEYEQLHGWAELRSTDAGFKVDPDGRALGTRWLQPKVVPEGREPEVCIMEPTETRGPLDVDLHLLLVQASEGAPFVAAAPAGARVLNPGIELNDGMGGHPHGAETLGEWRDKVEPGISAWVVCPWGPSDANPDARITRFRSGVLLTCSCLDHEDHFGEAVRAWHEDKAMGALVARPDVGLLDRLTWKTNPKTGKRVWPPKTNLTNVEVVLTQDARIKGRLRYNAMTGDLMLGREPITDARASELALWLERHYGFSAVAAAIGKAVPMVAERNTFDPMIDWMHSHDGLKPDGSAPDLTPDELLDTWLVRGFQAEDTPMTRMFGRRWLLQAAARAMHAGQAGDAVLVLVGVQQGTGKSKGLGALVGGTFEDPSPLFNSTALPTNRREAAQVLRRVFIYEIAELAGIRKRDVEDVKSFITNPVDMVRTPYSRFPIAIYRRTTFVATTNVEAFLADPTGNRRFWPVRIQGWTDFQWLYDHHGPLWKAALDALEAGETYHIEREEMSAVAEWTSQFEEEEPWDSVIARWLATGRTSTGLSGYVDPPPVFSAEWVARTVLGIPSRAINKGQLGQIGRAFSKVGGYTRKRLAIKGHRGDSYRGWFFVREGLTSRDAQRYLNDMLTTAVETPNGASQMAGTGGVTPEA